MCTHTHILYRYILEKEEELKKKVKLRLNKSLSTKAM